MQKVRVDGEEHKRALRSAMDFLLWVCHGHVHSHYKRVTLMFSRFNRAAGRLEQAFEPVLGFVVIHLCIIRSKSQSVPRQKYALMV